MRVTAPAAALAFALVLVVAAPAPAKVSDDVRTTALQTVNTNVDDAIKLELNALNLWTHGNKAGARSEIENSQNLLDGALGAADALTPPLDLSHYVPDHSGEYLGRNMRDAIFWDKRSAEKGANFHYDILLALQKKEAVYKLVNRELTHPVCYEAINLQRTTVDNVQQGPSQLSVDVACSQPEQKVIVALPANTVAKMVLDGSAVSATLDAPNVVEIKLNGAKSGGVTMQTTPDAAAPDPVDTGIVPIKGDSVEVFDDIM